MSIIQLQRLLAFGVKQCYATELSWPSKSGSHTRSKNASVSEVLIKTQTIRTTTGRSFISHFLSDNNEKVKKCPK